MRLGYKVEHIRVFDIYGKLLRHYPEYSKIDLQSEAEGIYHVIIEFDNGQLHQEKIALLNK